MTTTFPKISAAVITLNEAEDIAACLASIAFCDEIVVVDCGSDDDTVAIARGFGAKVSIETDWRGFGAQKQRAFDLTTGDWILSIDADERIPDALRDEILAAVRRPDVDGYRVNRCSFFLGRAMRHGGWFPDRVLRLARRGRVRVSHHIVHERLIVEGAVADLATEMPHHSFRTIKEVLDKQRRYAVASAILRRSQGRRGGLTRAVLRGGFGFVRHYLILGGFLDGRHGFVAAIAKAQETFWRYLAIGWEQ